MKILNFSFLPDIGIVIADLEKSEEIKTTKRIDPQRRGDQRL